MIAFKGRQPFHQLFSPQPPPGPNPNLTRGIPMYSTCMMFQAATLKDSGGSDLVPSGHGGARACALFHAGGSQALCRGGADFQFPIPCVGPLPCGKHEDIALSLQSSFGCTSEVQCTGSHTTPQNFNFAIAQCESSLRVDSPWEKFRSFIVWMACLCGGATAGWRWRRAERAQA